MEFPAAFTGGEQALIFCTTVSASNVPVPTPPQMQ